MACFTTHMELGQAMCMLWCRFVYPQSNLWRCDGATIWFVEMRWKCVLGLTDVVDLHVYMP